MAKRKKAKSKSVVRVEESPETVSTRSPESSKGFFDKISRDFQQNNSYLNLVLGALILIVAGVLLYNYFNRQSNQLGPSEQTSQPAESTQSADVAKENLPGKYTVKEGDTLFIIAEKYYSDGGRYISIVEANKLANENAIVVGQVLEIPKIETSPTPSASPEASPSPSTSPEAAASPQASPSPVANTQPVEGGRGGAENQTTWGETIKTNTYTVVAGDWLSTIAGRAYGDPMAYQKIAQANNINNPDLIEVGMVLKLPR